MKWEYLVYNEPDAILLADAGQNGWELVGIDPRVQGLRESRYVFKRLLTVVAAADPFNPAATVPVRRPRGRPPKLRPTLDA